MRTGQERAVLGRVLGFPVAPVGWTDLYSFTSCGLLPAFPHPYARKHKRMLAIVVQDGKFDLAVNRSA